MKYDEFNSLYTKLFKYFKGSDKLPDPEQIAEIYAMLKTWPVNRFAEVCQHIKETEERLPGNLVAYCNSWRREIGLLAVGGSGIPDPGRRYLCAACKDTGFIGIVCVVDPKTGKKMRKVREISDHGLEFAFRCACSIGQKMPGYIQFATNDEVLTSAKMN